MKVRKSMSTQSHKILTKKEEYKEGAEKLEKERKWVRELKEVDKQEKISKKVRNSMTTQNLR